MNTRDNILAVVCGVILCGDEEIPEFLALSTVPREANVEGAEDALLDAAYVNEMSGQAILDRYGDGVLVYFYAARNGVIKYLHSVHLKPADVRRIFNVQDDESDPDEAAWFFATGEPRPVTLGDLEPFAPPDDLEDIFVEPDWE